MQIFVNADILIGEVTDFVTLNRYAYANGNPVSNVDPFGLSVDERGSTTVYSGSIWGDSLEPDMGYSDTSLNRMFKLLSMFSLAKSENQHLTTWKNLVKLLSDKNMEPILLDMIENFCNGNGKEYSNDQLTNIVKYHPVTQKYMSDFSNVFKAFMSKNNGDYNSFAQSDSFKRALSNEEVLLSTYSYGGGLFDDDTWSGLTMAIHSWTESQVNVTNSFVLGDKYYTTLQFTFVDNFGLDYEDLKEFGMIPGFESWYALQHDSRYNGKYQPFKTIVTLDYQISGTIVR